MFAGIGGINLGFEQAGCEIAWANEMDKHACKTYRLNLGCQSGMDRLALKEAEILRIRKYIL